MICSSFFHSVKSRATPPTLGRRLHLSFTPLSNVASTTAMQDVYVQNCGLCLVGKDCDSCSLRMTSYHLRLPSMMEIRCPGAPGAHRCLQVKSTLLTHQVQLVPEGVQVLRRPSSSSSSQPVNKILWSNLHHCNAADWKHMCAHTLAASVSVQTRGFESC